MLKARLRHDAYMRAGKYPRTPYILHVLFGAERRHVNAPIATPSATATAGSTHGGVGIAALVATTDPACSELTAVRVGEAVGVGASINTSRAPAQLPEALRAEE